MNSFNTLPYSSSSSSSSSHHFSFTKWLYKSTQNSFSYKWRRSCSSRRNKFFRTSSKLHRFVSLTEDDYYDLKTLITADENNRVVFSYRKSTLQFTVMSMGLTDLLVFYWRTFFAAAITDYRTGGKDVTEHDIVQLRQICRASGVRVSFDTTNTRDAFYRASVNYVLDLCGSAPRYATLTQIDGEEARQFIVGLAQNIGPENIRASTMVSAALAARSCFLQAWALEVQGKHSEAVQELSKICLVLRTFPPEESSPEMEMVARGLGKHMKVEQR